MLPNTTLPPLSGMVQEIHGTYQVQYHPVDDDPDKVESGGGGCEGVCCFDLLPSPTHAQVFTVNWAPPFQRVYMIPELEKQLGVKFPPPSDFHSPGSLNYTTADIPSLSCLNGRHTVSLMSQRQTYRLSHVSYSVHQVSG